MNTNRSHELPVCTQLSALPADDLETTPREANQLPAMAELSPMGQLFNSTVGQNSDSGFNWIRQIGFNFQHCLCSLARARPKVNIKRAAHPRQVGAIFRAGNGRQRPVNKFATTRQPLLVAFETGETIMMMMMMERDG